MPYALSQRSLRNLVDVHKDLKEVVKTAIRMTSVDFMVIEGVRTYERQRKLVASGASKTMNSRHLTGHAVDLVAWVDGGIRWDWPLYFYIADGMMDAAKSLNVAVEWGGCWRDLREYESAEQAQKAYLEAKRRKGQRPFLDGPHFQLNRELYPA